MIRRIVGATGFVEVALNVTGEPLRGTTPPAPASHR